MDPNSILLITITVLLALLTIGVWGILFALVKSQGGLNAQRSAAVHGIFEERAQADRAPSSPAAKPAAFQIDKFLSETKPADSGIARLEDLPRDLRPSESVVQDLRRRSRLEEMPPEPSPQDKAEPLPQDLQRETVLVKEKESEEQPEPPAMDLRTGIITVEQDAVGPAMKKTAQRPSMEKAPDRPVKKAPVLPLKKKMKPQPPAKEPEEPFDFEKEIAANVERTIHAETGQPPFGDGEAPETKMIQTEKTMRWDKDELRGFSGRPESIVVEGGETVKAHAPSAMKKPDAMPPVPEPEAKQEEAMISGEDIENTLDSFFGLGDK